MIRNDTDRMKTWQNITVSCESDMEELSNILTFVQDYNYTSC